MDPLRRRVHGLGPWAPTCPTPKKYNRNQENRGSKVKKIITVIFQMIMV